MPMILRIELLIGAIIFLVLVVRSVNRKRLQLRYSLIWLGIALGMLIAACFPQIIIGLAGLVGIEVPANLIYLLAIIVLLIIALSLTAIVSKQSEQIKRLSQLMSIMQYESAQKEAPPHESDSVETPEK